jgi:hypothetical protein
VIMGMITQKEGEDVSSLSNPDAAPSWQLPA